MKRLHTNIERHLGKGWTIQCYLCKKYHSQLGTFLIRNFQKTLLQCKKKQSKVLYLIQVLSADLQVKCRMQQFSSILVVHTNFYTILVQTEKAH